MKKEQNLNNAETQALNIPVVSGSALISEFLGSKFINDAPEDYPNGYYYQPEGIENDCPTGLPEDWCFDSSWDWLMPVVGKIELDCKYDVHIYAHHNWKEANRCSIVDWKNNEIVQTSNDLKIKCVYDAVVEFIKWWNAR